LTRCPPYVLHRSGWRLPLLVQTGHGEQIPHYKGHGDVSDLDAPHESQHAPRGAWRRGPRPARLDAPRVPARTTRGATTWLSWTLPRTACRFPCLVPGHSGDQKRTKSAGLVRTRVDATRGQFSEGNRGGRRFSELAGLPPTRLRIPPPPRKATRRFEQSPLLTRRCVSKAGSKLVLGGPEHLLLGAHHHANCGGP
jgi:hypothetical protein